jgi:hypothetical protein
VSGWMGSGSFSRQSAARKHPQSRVMRQLKHRAAAFTTVMVAVVVCGGWRRPVLACGPFRLSGGIAATVAAAGLARCEREPGHVRPVGGFGAAGVLGFAQPGLGFADFALEPGEQPGLAAGGVDRRVFLRPAGAGGDRCADAALFAGEWHRGLLRAGSTCLPLEKALARMTFASRAVDAAHYGCCPACCRRMGQR